MEKWKSPETTRDHRTLVRDQEYRPPWADEGEVPRSQVRSLSAEQTIQYYGKELKKRTARRKWGGVGLFLLGVATTATSCPFYAVSLIGPHTVLVGLALLVAGGALFFVPPRWKDSTQAMMIALRHGNTLTVTKLAIGMDIPVAKAEKIIQDLVKSGIAEIDLDHRDPDGVLIYRLKGF